MTPKPEDPAEARRALLRRVESGEWLGPTDAAKLLGISRSTVVRRMDADPPTLASRPKTRTSKNRIINPKDLLLELGDNLGDDEGPSSV